jgi:hypothetical protein
MAGIDLVAVRQGRNDDVNCGDSNQTTPRTGQVGEDTPLRLPSAPFAFAISQSQ